MTVRALVFDVFGTVVDWRSGVAREVRRLLGERADPLEFADDWRGRYGPSMDRVRTGAQPWTPLDALHRASLDELLAECGLGEVDEPTRAELVLAWHRLDPWPDGLPGLTRLHRAHVLAPLSNGNIALMVDLARRSGLPWDAVLGAEVVRRYKPDPAVYDSASALLGLAPGQVCMVAAHVEDLASARARGLRTAYVHRPDEFGGRRTPPPTDPEADWSVSSMVDLADALGC